VFNVALALSGSYAVAYATFAVPSLVVGGWLLAARPGQDKGIAAP